MGRKVAGFQHDHREITKRVTSVGNLNEVDSTLHSAILKELDKISRHSPSRGRRAALTAGRSTVIQDDATAVAVQPCSRGVPAIETPLATARVVLLHHSTCVFTAPSLQLVMR